MLRLHTELLANIRSERGQPALALRVLSNLAEMDLENRHLLRILAYRLLQGGHVTDALPILERVEWLAPDEPQSYRDLGLALAQADQPLNLCRIDARPCRNLPLDLRVALSWDADNTDIDLWVVGPKG